MDFAPHESVRAELIESVTLAFERRFYEPTLHGVPLRKLLTKHHAELLTTQAFSKDLNALLSEVKAYPIEFFHESERRIGLWKAIHCSFHRSNGCWIFQDVLPNGWADRAGVQPGAQLLAVGGEEVDSSEIPKFVLSPQVQITFQNPQGKPQQFTFDPSAKEEENSHQYVMHRTLQPGIGYLRISKFPGVLGMGVAQATDQAIQALSKPSILIVDLRGNLGSVGAGNLRLMGYFTPDKKPVGYSLTRRRAEQGYRREDLLQFRKIPRYQIQAPLLLLKFKDADKSIVVVTEGLGKQPFHGRIILLVNEHTISGGEIVAGFASDHRLAHLVGCPTSGRLLAWSTLPLGHDCFLTLPTGNYLTWEGKSFEGTGVVPDTLIPFSPEAARNGQDNQLEAALQMARQL
jgi:carboxyl-terminal processing protease